MYHCVLLQTVIAQRLELMLPFCLNKHFLATPHNVLKQMKKHLKPGVQAAPCIRTQLFWSLPPPVALSTGGMVYRSRKQNEQGVIEEFRRTGGVQVGRWETNHVRLVDIVDNGGAGEEGDDDNDRRPG